MNHLLPSHLRPTEKTPVRAPSFTDDILQGAGEIRDYLKLNNIKQVYRLRDLKKDRPPIFKAPVTGISAFKSSLDAYYRALETRDKSAA